MQGYVPCVQKRGGQRYSTGSRLPNPFKPPSSNLLPCCREPQQSYSINGLIPPSTSFVDWEEIRHDREHTWYEITHSNVALEIPYGWISLSAHDCDYKTVMSAYRDSHGSELDLSRKMRRNSKCSGVCMRGNASLSSLIRLNLIRPFRRFQISACQDSYVADL